VFGDFLLVHRLATSHMADVAIAVRLGDRSGRTFVLKRPVLGERASGRVAQAIAREGEVLESVQAPEIVTLEAAGEIAGLPYVAVEHIRGAALDAVLAHVGALPPAAARAVARDLGRALAALHGAGWVHGDVTPSNVLVDDAGEARLVDFGLATRIGSKHVEIAGKPGYIAPEAVRGVDARPTEDVYGWGVVVAECALGHRLYPEHALAEAASRADAPRAVSDLGLWATPVCAAMRRDPAARPAASELATAFDEADLDRAALAAVVARVSAALEPDRAPKVAADAAPLTPTAPMRVEARAASKGESALAPAPLAGRPGMRLVAVAALVAALLGLVVGRVSARYRQGSISLSGTLPRRMQVELDGKPTTPPESGASLPIAPGRHTLVVTLPKGERREYTFHVRAGEQIVVLPLTRGAGEDKSP